MMCSRSILLALVALAGWFGVVRAQEDFHEFTDKRGQTVAAKLLGVSEDRRQMKIVRADGKEFEAVINQLSLDDQQYVKDWLKNRPGVTAASADFRLEIAIARTVGEDRKHRDETYTLEEKDHFFRITVKNLSRETLPAARIDYAVVWDNAVILYEDRVEGDWDYSTHSEEEPPQRAKILGGADLSNLRFNGVGEVTTTVVSLDRILRDGNELYREDEMIGVKVRVLAPDGSVIQEAHSGSAAIATMTWEEIGAIEDPRVIN